MNKNKAYTFNQFLPAALIAVLCIDLFLCDKP